MTRSIVDIAYNRLFLLTDNERNELALRLIDTGWYSCSLHPDAGVKVCIDDNNKKHADICCSECGFTVVGQVKIGEYQ